MTALAFRFRLYPNRKQEERMVDAIKTCHRLWNLALVDRKGAWEYRRLSTTYEEQCLMLTAEKQTDVSLTAVYSQSLEDVLKRLDRAFEAFFDRRAKYPRFKKFSESGSVTYPQAYNGSVKLDSVRRRIFLSKVGNVKVVVHRPIPFGARMKTCTLKREPDGKWYACLVYEDDGAVPLQGVRTGSWKSPVGVDRGLVSLMATRDGEKIKPPKFLRKSEMRLKRLQRGLARKKKGSKNREKARRLLAELHV
ncbi:MAG: transposase, partial [Nitrososphaerota archaeon]|nr:transposase [Nitrososphaerota archaeon]